MLILNFTYPLRCLRVPPVEYHCLRPLGHWDRLTLTLLHYRREREIKYTEQWVYRTKRRVVSPVSYTILLCDKVVSCYVISLNEINFMWEIQLSLTTVMTRSVVVLPSVPTPLLLLFLTIIPLIRCRNPASSKTDPSLLLRTWLSCKYPMNPTVAG
jgi:hypothetical protein